MNKKGFTLTELIAVIVILALLIGLSTTVFVGVKNNVLEKELDNTISYIETKAEEYAKSTSIITVTVEELIKQGYLTSDDGISIYNPVTKESMNCHLVNVEYKNGNYVAKYDAEKDLMLANGKCDTYEASSALKIEACDNDGCSDKEWYNQNVTLKIKRNDGAILNGGNVKYYWQGTDGYSGTSKEITTKIKENTYNTVLYKAVVNYEEGEKAVVGTATKAIKIDREKPIIKSVSLANENAWTSENKKLTVEYTDNNGSGVYGIYIGDIECNNLSIEDYTKVSTNTYKTNLGNGTYNICVIDKAGNVGTTADNKATKVEKVNRNEYTVTYKCNNCTTKEEKQVVHVNDNVTTKVEANEHYNLNGATISGQGCKIANDTVIATEVMNDITCIITAQPNIYPVNLNNQSATGGGTTTVYEKYDVNYSLTSGGASVVNITKPTKAAHEFQGYYTGTNGSGTKVIDANGDILVDNTFFTQETTLYAKWKALYTCPQGTMVADSSRGSSTGGYICVRGYTYSYENTYCDYYPCLNWVTKSLGYSSDSCCNSYISECISYCASTYNSCWPECTYQSYDECLDTCRSIHNCLCKETYCSSYGSCLSWSGNGTYTYGCNGGWSRYDGSGSSTRCYKGATLGS